MVTSFSDHVMSLKVDVDSIESTATDEWEQMGEEFAKELSSEMNFKFEYILDDGMVKLRCKTQIMKMKKILMKFLKKIIM